MTLQFKIARQNRKIYFWQIRRPIAPKHLIFIKNAVHQKTENRIEKSFFYQEFFEKFFVALWK